MARMRMKSQANRFLLSYFWWFLEPLLFVVLFYIIFGYVLDRGGERYFEFLIIGKIIFMWFSKGVTMGSNSLVQNRGIIGQSSIPKWIFPLAISLEATYKAFISFIIMFAVVVFNYSGGYIPWLQLIPIAILLMWFISCLAMLLSIFVAAAEDISQLISLFMMGMLFSSGIFWDINSINDQDIAELIYNINPLALYIDSFRKILMEGETLEMSRFIIPTIINVIITLASLYGFHRANNKITRLLFS